MTRKEAINKAIAYVKRTGKYDVYVVDDGPDSGYQVCREHDLDGFFDGCPIIWAGPDIDEVFAQ